MTKTEMNWKTLSDALMTRRALFWREAMRKIFPWHLVVVLGAPAIVAAQQPTRNPRIGYLSGVSPSAEVARRDAFTQGLRDLGYVDGKSMVIEWRSADGNVERGRALAAELVRLKTDVIVTAGAASTRTAKAATT